MSFKNKIDDFLLRAKEKNIIDDNICKNLQEFAVKSNSKSSINIFLGSIGFLGAFAILGGLILILSHNWWGISNSIKIATYIITLISFHIIGIIIKDTYPKTSEVLHFIGAGYVLAGIGLIAQIYNLSSTDGKPIFLWFIMILPMAIILKHKWIGLMSIFSFYLWLNIYLGHHDYYRHFRNVAFYFTIFGTNLILIPKLFNSFNNCFNYAKIIGFIIIAIIIITMGFSHTIYSGRTLIIPHWIVGSISILNFITLLYFIIRERREKLTLKFDTTFSILLIIINLLPLFFNGDRLTISILYWIVHFAFGVLLIYQGVLKTNATYINYGAWCIAIGIFLRFIDVVGSILFSGSIFILFGIILLTLAFLIEKFRRNLIIKIQSKNV